MAEETASYCRSLARNAIHHSNPICHAIVGSNSDEAMPAPSSSPNDNEAAEAGQPSLSKDAKKKKTYQQVQMPSHEQIMQEDFMNNCAIRTGLSGVMGLGLGAMFGVAMGTFDTAVRCQLSIKCFTEWNLWPSLQKRA